MNDTATQPNSPTADVADSVDVLRGPAANAPTRELLAKIDSPAETVQIGDETIPVAAGNRIMNSATEMAGPSGANVTGGELTPPQDAEQTLDENIAQRDEEQDMFRRQMEEEVETQTKDLEPDNNPDSGSAAEDSGAAQEQRDDSAPAAGGTAANASTRGGAAGEEDDHTRYLRALADLENFKRQSLRRENEARERSARRVIEDILPVLDNFERAVEAAKTARDVDSVRIGIEFVAQQLRDALKGHGVQPIETSGAKFDPLHHEALEEVPGTDHAEGAIIDEVQRGYTHNGQVLRTSRVRVAGR